MINVYVYYVYDVNTYYVYIYVCVFFAAKVMKLDVETVSRDKKC